MAMTDLSIVRRSLTARLFSTVITAVSVAVAVSLMLVLLSMRDAGYQAFSRGSGNMHLLISRDRSPLVSVLNGVFYASPPRAPIQWNEYERLRGQYPFSFAVPVVQGDSYAGLPVLATSGEFFTRFSPDPGFNPDDGEGNAWTLREGEFFDANFEVVIGSEAARRTGLRIGDSIYLTHGTAGSRDAHVHKEYSYVVVGVLDPSGTAHDRALFTDLESSWILHANDRVRAETPGAPLATVDDLQPRDRLITGVFARVATRPGSDASAAMQQVFYRLRADPTLTVASPKNQIDALFRIVSNIDQIFVAMAGIVMLSSGIGILLSLYNSMEQRRRQIAVLRVLGASRGRVFALVLTESAMIGLIGGIAGVAMGLVGQRVVSGIMQARLGLVIDPSLAPRWTLGIVVVTVALAALAGLIPAASAYRTSVARNLRPLG